MLSGAEAPSGWLTVSVPRSAEALPYFYNHKLKSAGTPIALHFGSRYPFGHGLGYTTFACSDLALAQARVPIDGSEDIAPTFTVRNTGERSGVEVAQLYVRDRHASVVRPVRELKAFQRLVLAPGEAVRVQFSVPVDMLQLTDPAGAGWWSRGGLI